jgi:hypothetical protein
MKDCVSHALRIFRVYDYTFRSYECISHILGIRERNIDRIT